MALNFALMVAFNPLVMNAILSEDIFIASGTTTLPYIISILVVSMFTILISMALFAPIWFLLDAGIVYSNKEKVESKDDPIEIRSVGGWYYYLLKGYAGIGVIVSYYILFSTFIFEIREEPIILIVNLIALGPLMIYFTMATIPAVVLLDITKKNRVKYVRKWAIKLGITDYVKISFEKINK